MNPLTYIATQIKRQAVGPCRLPAPLSWRMLCPGSAISVQRMMLREYLKTGRMAARLMTLAIALLFWPWKSFRMAWQMTSRYGSQASHVRKRSIQFLQQLNLAWVHGISPAMYYRMGIAVSRGRISPDCWIQSGYAGLLSRVFRDDKRLSEINDKLLFTRLMEQNEVPVAPVLAVFEDGVQIQTASSRYSFDCPDNNAIFVKPCRSSGGRDSLAWHRSKSGQWTLTGSSQLGHEAYPARWLKDGASFSPQELTVKLAEFSRSCCLLVQPRVFNHRALERIFGTGLVSVRVLSGVESDGIRILRAIIYPPFLNSITSQRGFIIDVDLSSGQLGRAFRHTPDQRFFPNHPQSGAVLEGVFLPFWQDVLTQVRRAHHVLSDYPFLGWDVAISPHGAVVLEANGNFATDSLQKAGSKPLIDEQFLEVFEYWREKTKVSGNTRSELGAR